MKLTKLLESLIIETASYGDIYNSIKDRQVLVIYYDGDEPGGKGERVIEPVALGESTAGNKVLRAWDYEGASHSAYIGEKPLPGWRMFRLDKILFMKQAGYTFDTPRPNYNPTGDRKMTKVYINANFATPTPEPQAEPETTKAPEEPTQSWIDRVKNKFKGFFSRFKK
jgi:hypothetical protein